MWPYLPGRWEVGAELAIAVHDAVPGQGPAYEPVGDERGCAYRTDECGDDHRGIESFHFVLLNFLGEQSFYIII